MNVVEVHDLLFEKLQANGVAEFVHRELSQVLEFPEEFFVEVVLRDAAKMPQAERAILELTEILKAKGVVLNPRVRAIWKSKPSNWRVPLTASPGFLATPFAFVCFSGQERARNPFM
jgi:hypothetical protein